MASPFKNGSQFGNNKVVSVRLVSGLCFTDAIKVSDQKWTMTIKYENGARLYVGCSVEGGTLAVTVS